MALWGVALAVTLTWNARRRNNFSYIAQPSARGPTDPDSSKPRVRLDVPPCSRILPRPFIPTGVAAPHDSLGGTPSPFARRPARKTSARSSRSGCGVSAVALTRHQATRIRGLRRFALAVASSRSTEPVAQIRVAVPARLSRTVPSTLQHARTCVRRCKPYHPMHAVAGRLKTAHPSPSRDSGRARRPTLVKTRSPFTVLARG